MLTLYVVFNLCFHSAPGEAPWCRQMHWPTVNHTMEACPEALRQGMAFAETNLVETATYPASISNQHCELEPRSDDARRWKRRRRWRTN